MSRGDYAAFPRPYSRDMHTGTYPIVHHATEGMTIRECAAIAAMQGLLSAGLITDVQKNAVRYADMLINELNKPAHLR